MATLASVRRTGSDGRLRADGGRWKLVRPPRRGRLLRIGSAPSWPGPRSGEEGEEAERTSRPRRPRMRERAAKPADGDRRSREAAGKRAEKPSRGEDPRRPEALSRLAEQRRWTYRIVASRPSSSRRVTCAATWLYHDQIIPTRSASRSAPYRATLDDRRHLPKPFEIVDAARKVVGVGRRPDPRVHRPTPGTRRARPALLAVGGDGLRAGEYWQQHVPAARRTGGAGQRMMQAASDIYLGWTQGVTYAATTTGGSSAT